jgi:hypothetical protein
MAPELEAARDLIGIGTPVFLAGGFWYMTWQLKRQVDQIKEDLKLLNKVVLEQALSNQRQDNFEQRTDYMFKEIQDDIRELKHGKGFITPP